MTEGSPQPPEPLRDAHSKAYSSAVFRHLLECQSRRAIRYQEAFALLCVALDRNGDEEERGDEEIELAIVAENIRREMRQTDLIGRDGEMLTILLLYAGDNETAQVAERVRTRIENYAFPGGSTQERVSRTVSIGGSCFPMHAVDSSLLVEHALSNFRRVQEEGGNNVLLSQNGSGSEESPYDVETSQL